MTEQQEKPGTLPFMARHAGAVGRAYQEYTKVFWADETLSMRDKELIFIGVQTALNLQSALKSHIPRALKFGVTRQEIAAAMMVGAVNGGLDGALAGIALLEATPNP